MSESTASCTKASGVSVLRNQRVRSAWTVRMKMLASSLAFLTPSILQIWVLTMLCDDAGKKLSLTSAELSEQWIVG